MTPQDIIEAIEYQNSVTTALRRDLAKAEADRDSFKERFDRLSRDHATDLEYWRDKYNPSGTLRLIRKDGFERMVSWSQGIPPVFYLPIVPEITMADPSSRPPSAMAFRFERMMHAPQGSHAKVAIYQEI